MSNNRPDSFLHLIRRAQKGKLKIYLGYCAGVGKTYQMLLEAHRLKEDGIDIAVGLVETHKRIETEELVKGLELIPLRKTIYHSIEIEEMDLNAVLTRHPEVVLVDELAHTNIPGSKNSKRYQDVEEILSAGIHVISTLNIQHLESLYEIVERATGIKVRERIPDGIVAEADQIVNVDITSEDLRRRLKEGKVYTAERIEVALENFFKNTNLEQLRELTLRELAAQIDSHRRDPLAEHIPPAPDQLAVCLSSRGPNSEALLRYASRLAGRLNRNWYAVYVQTASENPIVISAETQRILSNTLTLAHQLGATVFTYKGDDVVKTILQFAKEYRVGHIVVGIAGRKPSFLERLVGKTDIVTRLIEESKGITIVVVDTNEAQILSIPKPPSNAESRVEKNKSSHPKKKEALISPVQIVLWPETVEKEEALRQLLDICCREQPAIIRENAWEKIIQRERQGVTFAGEGVAIPHAKINELAKPVLAMGVCKTGIVDRDSRSMVQIMIMLFSPDAKPDLHLKLLGKITKMAQNDSWRKNILEAKNVTEIAELLQGLKI
jgi:two-component system sensor histidine kinase KdpD